MAAIKVADLGIASMRPRRAVTGGLILEITGSQGSAKAAALKAKLAEQLGGTGIKVHCPQKLAEFRVCGLTELASVEAVRGAIAAQGACAADDVAMGVKRPGVAGLFSLWVRAPVAAAAKLLKASTVVVDSLAARVVPLAQRKLQCFRCLEFGHVRAKCSSPVDRSDVCYRCGGEGHAARFCLAPPACPLCAAANLPSGHRMGGPACRPPPVARTGVRKDRGRTPATTSGVRSSPPAGDAPATKTTASPPPVSPPEVMETDPLASVSMAGAGAGKRKDRDEPDAPASGIPSSAPGGSPGLGGRKKKREKGGNGPEFPPKEPPLAGREAFLKAKVVPPSTGGGGESEEADATEALELGALDRGLVRRARPISWTTRRSVPCPRLPTGARASQRGYRGRPMLPRPSNVSRPSDTPRERVPLHASARPAGAGSRGDGRRAGRHRRAVSAGGPLLSVHQSGSASGDDVGDGTGSPVVFGRPTRAGLDGGGMGKPPSGRLLPGTEIHGPGVRGPAERGGGVSSPPISSACGPPGGFQRPRSRVGRPQDRPPGRGAARVGGGMGFVMKNPHAVTTFRGSRGESIIDLVWVNPAAAAMTSDCWVAEESETGSDHMYVHVGYLRHRRAPPSSR